MKSIFSFLKTWIAILLIQLAIGFSMVKIVGNGQPGFIIEIIDVIISFPISLWNAIFPEIGIYRGITSSFWLVIIFNAFCQTLVFKTLVSVFKSIFKKKNND